MDGGFLASLSIVTQTGRGTTNFENFGWQTETTQQALWSSTKGARQKDGVMSSWPWSPSVLWIHPEKQVSEWEVLLH